MQASFVLNDLFLTIGPLGSSTMGRFSVVSMASKCTRIIGISGYFCVGWPYSLQTVQGIICRGSAVAFAFFPLALFGWGGVGASAVVGFCGSSGG